jgi:hypothetical protein
VRGIASRYDVLTGGPGQNPGYLDGIEEKSYILRLLKPAWYWLNTDPEGVSTTFE